VAGIEPEAQPMTVNVKSFLKSSSRSLLIFLMPLSRLLLEFQHVSTTCFLPSNVVAIAPQRCRLQRQPAAMLLSPRVGSDTEGEGGEGDRRVTQPWFSRATATYGTGMN